MRKTAYNKWKYQFINEFIEQLESNQKEALSSAKESLEYCTDSETGEVNMDNWNYNCHLDYLAKAEAIGKLIEELEKF